MSEIKFNYHYIIFQVDCKNDVTTVVELPSDVWNIILNNLTNNTASEKDYQYIALSFISSVSKHTNLICENLKRLLRIHSIKARPYTFQSYFAKNGYLNCIKYAHENGCPWDEDTCSYASENGHLECIKYARENGCLWNEETCSYAALNVLNLTCFVFSGQIRALKRITNKRVLNHKNHEISSQ